MAILAGVKAVRLMPKLSCRALSFSHSTAAAVLVGKHNCWRLPVAESLFGTFTTHREEAGRVALNDGFSVDARPMALQLPLVALKQGVFRRYPV